MDLAEVKHVMGILARLGVPVVGITGGEPLLRQDLDSVLEVIARLGMKSTIVTNGELLTADRLASLRRFNNIVHFALSVDSLDLETYSSVRGKKVLPAALAGFLAAIPAGPRTVYKLNVVLGPHNVEELDGFMELAQATGLALSFIPVNVAPGGLHRAEKLDGLDRAAREQLAAAFRKLYRWKLDGKPLWDHRDYYLLASRYMLGEDLGECMAGRLFLDVRSDGKLAVCNEMEHFADLLELDDFSISDLKNVCEEWGPRIDACRRGAACCYTCSYNVTATARNIPAYIWDYFRLKALSGRR